MTFNQALRAMPRFVTGLDLMTQTTVDDLRWLVQFQMDLYEEGPESEIRSQHQYEMCARYLTRTGPFKHVRALD